MKKTKLFYFYSMVMKTIKLLNLTPVYIQKISICPPETSLLNDKCKFLIIIFFYSSQVVTKPKSPW